MDPKSFFDIVLPSTGLRVIAIPATTRDGKPYFRHFFGDTNAWLVEASQHLDANRQLNVYYGCASFDPNGAKSASGTLERKQANVAAVRSFWLDVDCGPGKPYAAPRDGAAAVLRFAATVGLPVPYIVISGNGIHAYWPMSEDMSPAAWLPTAQLLKAACKAEGLLADPSRTSDHASVLRPPGTHHRKAAPKLVRVAVEGTVQQLTDFQQILLPYATGVALQAAEDDVLGPRPDYVATEASDDLSAGIEHRPSSSARIAKQCGVLALVRDTKGNVDQPTWYHSLGVMAFTKDGAELAHEWSSGHPDYSPAETDRKLEQVSKMRPTSCSKLSDFQPAICAACPHNGQIKTPYSLGLYDPEAVPVQISMPVQNTDGGWIEKQVEVDNVDGYRIILENCVPVLQSRVLNDEGAWVWETFCESGFRPTSRLWIEGVAHIEVEMDMKGGVKRRFTVEGGTIGKGKDTLAAELARNEIVPRTGGAHLMDSYMKKWMTWLKDNAPQITAYRHFGWTDERGFALGDVILSPGGGRTRAILVGMAKSKAAALEPAGDLATWVDVINRAYNAPGQEGYQFLVACSFAAPLLSMMQQVNGLTVYAHSEGSGVGKTTAQRAGLSAWGDWEALMLAEGKTTQNAMWGLMGAYHSLPVVYDELTNQKNDVASELVFSVSSGRSKERMRADGELRENNSNWCTILLASGNTLLSEKLALHRGNAEAEMSRLFEFTLTATPHLSPNEANALFPKLMTNYGHAGRVYAQYLVDNYDAVAAKLLETQNALNTQLGITQMERYWSALLAATLVSVAICRNLNLLQFDLAGLRMWLVKRLKENRVQRNEASNDPLELLGTMLSELWQGILVTNGEGDLRKGVVASVIEKPKGPLVGRAILPDTTRDKNSQPVLMLNAQAVRDWANKKGVSAKEMFNAAVAAGWCDQDHIRYALGRGTVEYAQTSSYIRCWKMNPDRISGSASGQLVSQKLGVVQGGKEHAAGGAG